METRSNYVLVGSVTLALLVGLLIFIVWLAGLSNKAPGGRMLAPQDPADEPGPAIGKGAGRMTSGSIRLYSYWRSSAAYRVRIALNLKGLPYETMPVHLLKDGGEQHSAQFADLNPQELVPVLLHGSRILRQSMAIIEYLDETWPSPPLMPATARWVARKIGLKDWRWSQVTDVDVNVSLGTWYLKHVLEVLDGHPVLASAAYNAGPGRARAWRPEAPIEGAIYAETIPFNETRDYVKKVMANAGYYSHTLSLSQQVQSLKQRLGVIGPRMRDKEISLGDTP